MENEHKYNGSNLFSYFACFTFMVFFCRIGEISPFLAAIHINLLSFAVTLLLFLFGVEHKAIDWSRNRATKLMVLFLCWGLLTVPFGVWPTNALDIWKGNILINTLICFFCLASIQNEKQLARAVYAFLIGTFLLVSALHINPIYTSKGRAFIAYSYDPNDLALIFAVTFPLVVAQLYVADTKGRILLSGYLLLLVSAILKTESRGGLLALGVAVLLILFSSVVKVKMRYKALLILVIVFFGLSPAAGPVLERSGQVISGKDYNFSNTTEGVGGRIAIWKAGLKLFGENFFLGVGLDNSSTAMGERYGRRAWKTMHNTYLQAALEMGIGGIILLLLILRLIWTNCSQVIKEYAGQSLHNRIIISAYFFRISFLTFIIASFFLSQAYSVIIPFFLIISDRVKFLSIEN